jgi:hypothetical protein
VQYVQQNLYDKEIKKYGKLLSFVFSPDAWNEMQPNRIEK